MFVYFTVQELIEMHNMLLGETGGSSGIRDRGLLESAHGQPLATFGGVELYPSLFDKASALCFSIIKNHPFVDCNKRTGYLAATTLLALNGYLVAASVMEKYDFVINVATSKLSRDEISAWFKAHCVPVS